MINSSNNLIDNKKEIQDFIGFDFKEKQPKIFKPKSTNNKTKKKKSQ